MTLKSTALTATVLFAFAVSGLAETAKLIPFSAEQEFINENSRFSIAAKTRQKILDLVPEGGFQEGKYYEFMAQYENINCAFLTGKEFTSVVTQRNGVVATNILAEQVLFTPVLNKEAQEWYGIQITETSTKKSIWGDIRFPGARNTINLNYVMPEQTFATIDNVARWQEKEAATLKRDLLKEDVRLGVEVAGDELRFFVNGVFMRHLLRENSDIANYKFRIQQKAVVSDALRVVDCDPLFRTVDISERLNAAGLPDGGSPKDLTPGTTIDVHGIPFSIPMDKRFDNVDLSMSWVEIAMRCGYTPTRQGARWPAPSSKRPLRNPEVQQNRPAQNLKFPVKL